MADNVSVWDGVSFEFMSREAADKRVKKGGCQIATGLTNHQLKTQAELRKKGPKTKPTTKPANKQQQEYSTRDMTASNKKVTPIDDSSSKDATIPGFG